MRPDRPALSATGVCGCGSSRIRLKYDGRLWCAICALFIIGDAPARVYAEICGEPLAKRGRAIRSDRLVSV